MASPYNSAKTGYMDTYNAAHAHVMINGVEIYGFGQDDMISVSFSQDRQSFSQDPQGTGVRSINNKTGATITVNLSQMSPARKMMTALLNQTEEFSFDYRDDAAHFYSNYCFINKSPDYQAGNTAGNRAWAITAINLYEDSVGGIDY